MIVDVHSHAWEYPTHFGDDFLAQAKRARAGVEVDPTVRYDEYRRAATTDTRTVVFGGKARLSGLWVDDEYVARYVADHPDTLVGFLSVDPTQPGWERELEDGHRGLGLRGVKLLPMYAGFTPDDPRLDPLWAYATRHRLPVLMHTGTTFVSQAPLDCTLPRHVDRAAIRWPEATMIMAHLAHPYEGECVAVIRKHPNVYADLTALHTARSSCTTASCWSRSTASGTRCCSAATTRLPPSTPPSPGCGGSTPCWRGPPSPGSTRPRSSG